MEQLALDYSPPKPKRRGKSPFESNRETGLYFWMHSGESGSYQFSNRPHELLPHYCAEHEWYSDVPCRAEHREVRAA